MDSKKALAELKNFQSTRKGAGDYYTQFMEETGANEARQSQNDVKSLIRNTESALRGVNASVAGRTRGFGVNEAQRARLENLERAPIAEELNTLSGRYADEMTNYRDLLSMAGTRAGQAYQTDADRLSALESNYGKIYQKERDAAEEKRWRKEFAESRRQFEKEMAQLEKNSQKQLAAIRASYSTPSPSTNSGGNSARANAIAAEAARLSEPKPTPKYNGNKKVVDKGGWDGLISQGWQNIQDYGPLALFGGGSLWR